jgi:hypothetical protein
MGLVYHEDGYFHFESRGPAGIAKQRYDEHGRLVAEGLQAWNWDVNPTQMPTARVRDPVTLEERVEQMTPKDVAELRSEYEKHAAHEVKGEGPFQHDPFWPNGSGNKAVIGALHKPTRSDLEVLRTAGVVGATKQNTERFATSTWTGHGDTVKELGFVVTRGDRVELYTNTGELAATRTITPTVWGEPKEPDAR